MADELYDVRNSLLVGNYHQVIADGSSVRTSRKGADDVAAFNADRDALVARAQIGLGQFDAVISELATTKVPLLAAVRQLAQIHKEIAATPASAAATTTTATLQQLTESVAGEPKAALADVAAIAAAGLILVNDVPGALTLVARWVGKLDANSNPRQVIDLRAILADGYMRLNRPDLAEKEVNAMKAIDDESSVAILLGGMVALRMAVVRPERLSEATSAFGEINSRCGTSVSVLNLMVIANTTAGKPRDAERNLLDALAKRSGDPDTVANMAVVAAQLGKPPEAVAKHVNQAKHATPASSWARQYSVLEQRFAEAAKI